MDVTRVLPRDKAEESCYAGLDRNTCEKPALTTGQTMGIFLVAGAIVATAIVILLFFLHRRRQKIERMEDVKDLQELDDYGLATTQKSRMPKAPPPTYAMSQDRQADDKWKGSYNRDSTDSLSPSLRQAMGVAPRDILANK
ncbi:hypothetical protein FZEAL_7310 [Fusarium zealandicum]|uniref:Uncharacterized protein n=1 Tax=Fusarium zealandicum TaxID=1053134 RepID=A0A8H4UGR8_9HYPO|nr:hypothetical protein FZEAL_7310 [Fusarium zealandicum]